MSRTINEPRLTVELEDDDKMPSREWTAKAMLELAGQLGVMNDYYFPLLGAAGILRSDAKRVRAERERDRIKKELWDNLPVGLFSADEIDVMAASLALNPKNPKARI